MACNCKDRTVLDFMDENGDINTDGNPVINCLLDAMAALDDIRSAENLSENNKNDLIRIAAYREMHSKLDATIKYIKVRL